MKVLMLNGSPKDNGNTAAALAEMKAVFEHLECLIRFWASGFFIAA